MHCKLLIGVLFISVIFTSSDSVRISSKLDLINTSNTQSAPKIQETLSHSQRSAVKQVKREDSQLKFFDKVAVVCTSDGCNTTKLTDTDGKDSVKTDVLVHVQTSVEKKGNGTHTDDTPDVPVVVGLAGTEISSSSERPFTNSNFNTEHSVFQPNNPQFLPFQYNPSQYSSFQSTPSTFKPLYVTYSSNDFKPSHTYGEEPNLSSLPEPKVDLSFKILQPMDDFYKDARYKLNGIEMYVSHFEPSYNNHYFGEQPPPQLLWYPNSIVNTNPVEFKSTPKATSNPSIWPALVRNPEVGTFKNNGKHSITCQCPEHHRGLQWYPNNRRVYNPLPGSQINDKLAPLN